MASVIAESCVGARNTVHADAYSVDHIHPKKKTIYSGRVGPAWLRWSSGGVEWIDGGVCVPVCGSLLIGGPI